MATLEELDAMGTVLERSSMLHLQRLTRTWGLLADISFADLLLFARSKERVDDEPGLTILSQIRPSTSQTAYQHDMVGKTVPGPQRPLVSLAFERNEEIDGGILFSDVAPRLRLLAVPVRHRGEVIAVLSREFSPDAERIPGDLELNYFNVFRRLAQMVTDGVYPFPVDHTDTEEAPRIGDGGMVLDAESRIVFASPNAVTTLNRLGIHSDLEGERLVDIGLQQRAVRSAFATRLPHTEEIIANGITSMLRCLPLIEGGRVTGGLVMVRDISELRRRDQLLLSKDATIAEVHHRVKNNLQTISSLLRLQIRRVDSAEAKSAIEESVRRIRSIAIVHEILSREVAEDVPFSEILRPLVRMVEEGLVSPERPIRFTVDGVAGELPATLATPLAVVLTELLQNIVDHAYPDTMSFDHPGQVRIELGNDEVSVTVRIVDDGVGLSPLFSFDGSTGLGLTIVQTLVTNDLGGSIEVLPGEGSGDRPGTVIELSFPVLESWRKREDSPAEESAEES